jgi:osmotically-inducible protein OsmY
MAMTTYRWTFGRTLLGLALLLAPTAVTATETGPDIAPGTDIASAMPTARDLKVLIRIRRVLTNDDVLAPMNVGIIVRSGVVTLWGPLANEDEINHAIKSVADVRGVQSVKSELYVSRGARPMPPLFVLPENTTPAQDPSLPPAKETILTLRDRLAPNESVAATLPTPGGARLMSPVSIEAGPEAPTTVTAARTEGVTAAIERLQFADARFAQIQVEWRDGTILLRGNRNDAGAAMAFARQLSDVPGVERVVLQSPKKIDR